MQLAKQEPQAQQKPSAMLALAQRCNVDPAKLTVALKETVFAGAKDSELLALVVISNEYNLNPFLKEIFAFPSKGGGITPMVGVDGWLKIINNHPQHDGIETDMAEDGSSCTCRIYRKDRTKPTVVTEYLDECKRNTDPWRQSPKRMLRHRAIIQCARVAYGFSGIKDEDELPVMEKSIRVVAPTFEETVTDPEPEQEAPKNRKPRKAAPVEDAQPSLPVEEPAPLGDVETLMERDGISGKTVLDALAEYGIVNPGQYASTGDLPASVRKSVVDGWNQILDFVAAQQ